MNRVQDLPDEGRSLTVAGLFAGIGGIERGLHLSGHRCELLCEVLPEACDVLRAHFPGVVLERDVRELKDLPQVELLAAGFPCQDLSQVGRAAGIEGPNSSLIRDLFRLLEDGCRRPDWIVLENVPFMLQLERGRAMKFLVDQLGQLGYWWAYRIIDTRAFGLPHRRRRVILLATRSGDPRGVLLGQDAGSRERGTADPVACGFYWTEGNRGLGWAVDAIPTLKRGSGLGIPSPPGIWQPGLGFIGTPDLRDAERLQGFPVGWTTPAVTEGHIRPNRCWALVGNAVSVPVFQWLGTRLRAPATYEPIPGERVHAEDRWPTAAWGNGTEIHRVPVSEWPVQEPYQPLLGFLSFPLRPLSERSTAGFLMRARASSLRMPVGFLEDVSIHLERLRTSPTAPNS